MNGNDDDDEPLVDDEADNEGDLDSALATLGFTDAPGTAPATPAGPDPAVELAKAQARADAYKEELARRDAEAQNRPAPEPVRPQVVPDQPQPTRITGKDLIPKDFKTKWLTDADEAIAELGDNLLRAADRLAQERVAPQSATAADQVIDSFIAQRRAEDPEEYALAIKHFNQVRAGMSPQALAHMASQPREFQLRIMQESWDSSYAKGFRESKKAPQRQPTTPAPRYSGGSGGGGTAPTPSGGGDGMPGRLTEMEKDLVARAKSMGLSKADTIALVKESRAELRAARGA